MVALPTATEGRRVPNRWVILALGMASQASSSSFLFGLPMLLPQLRSEEHLSLAGAGWVVAAPTFGLLCTLLAWGAMADRYGERNVMALGLGMSGCFILGAAAVNNLDGRVVLFVLAGASGASVNAASGRVVLGWFAPHERGTAMGARQTAQPLGVGIAALTLPAVGAAAGVGWALTIPALLCLVVAAAVAIFVVDPPRSVTTPGLVASGSPYREPTLWRLHGASTLLVVPQFAISAFALEYLVSVRHWSPAGAGRLLFVFQVCGAAGRLAAGYWSDRAGSRLRPMRLVALGASVVMLAVALGAATSSTWVVVALGVGAVITVADNGLGFTAAAELAGSAWAGRALGAQNSAQSIASTLTPPLLGGLIGLSSYSVGFAVVAVFPLLAILVTPAAAETALRSRTAAAEAPQDDV
jgi:sugar phosphate permease